MINLKYYYEDLAQYVLRVQREILMITDQNEGALIYQKLSTLYYLIYQQIQDLSRHAD